MSERPSFYVLEGENLLATDYTRGPWSRELQHGGPPAAALARAMRLVLADDDWLLTRLSFDLLRPVPVASMVIEVEERGSSRSTRRLWARLEVAGKTVIEAHALALRRTPIELPEMPKLPQPRAVELCDPLELPSLRERDGYHRAFDVRRASGVYGKGATTTWMRARVDLVAGETMAPCECVLVVADSCAGLSPVVDPQEITFVNADLNVHLLRELRGEWIAIAATSALCRSGRGISRGQLYDTEGPVGAVLQSLVVRRLVSL